MTGIQNERKHSSLKKQFSIKMLIMMLVVAAFSGAVQLVMMNDSVEERVLQEAVSISTSIEQGITETDLAATAIEHQIDLKLESYSKYIAEQLNGRPFSEITNEELSEIRDQLGITGISLLQVREDDIVGVRSTDKEEIGFSLRGANPFGYEMLNLFAKGEFPEDAIPTVSYVTDETTILFISQSGSHDDKPMFYKYAYHKVAGTDYLIDPYIEANEVYQFIQQVGPDSWIEQVLQANEHAIEIGVLDPRVFADPSLAENMYPPLTKIVNGTFILEEKRDTEILISMLKSNEKQSYVETYEGKEVYKSFQPMENGKVMYVALDYNLIKAPFQKQLIILIGTSLLSLLVLFILTTTFFNRIYKNIQKIINQIRHLEKGDFTTRSQVNDKGELASLSESTNKMTNSLNNVLLETQKQAVQTERLAYLLEVEANSSVDKVYTLSMEHTTSARETVDETLYIIDQLEDFLNSISSNEAKDISEKLQQMRKMTKESSNLTTEMTLTLSDLLKSLHSQSASLSDISKKLLKNLEQFELKEDEKSV